MTLGICEIFNAQALIHTILVETPLMILYFISNGYETLDMWSAISALVTSPTVEKSRQISILSSFT